jgi:hypothetical protein
MLTLATIAEQWTKKLTQGEIRYDPHGVESRWIVAPGDSAGFKAILNSGRKDRLEKRAA